MATITTLSFETYNLPAPASVCLAECDCCGELKPVAELTIGSCWSCIRDAQANLGSDPVVVDLRDDEEPAGDLEYPGTSVSGYWD